MQQKNISKAFKNSDLLNFTFLEFNKMKQKSHIMPFSLHCA